VIILRQDERTMKSGKAIKIGSITTKNFPLLIFHRPFMFLTDTLFAAASRAALLEVQMKTYRSLIRAFGAASLTALVSVMLGTAALAQFGGPPPQMGPGMRGPRPLSVANLSVAALSSGLRLTSDQKTKIAAIQSQFKQQRQALMPTPGDGPPDPQTMRATMDKVRSLDQQAATDIKALLTDTQKQALSGLIKTLDDLGFAGIPPETLGDLNLTSDQKTKITAFVEAAKQADRAAMDSARQSGDPRSLRETMRSDRDQAVQKTMALLTDAQKAVVTKFKASHPQPGPGGFGPPPPGGGFGPPPSGGFGPPPPADNG